MTVYHTTLRGSVGIGTARDGFSHSLCISSNSSDVDVANAIRTSWIEFWQGGGGGIDASYNNSTVYEEVTVARVIDPMVPDLAAAYHAPFAPLLPGLSAEPPLPQQTAVVVSLTAGLRPNGTPFRGRFFMPAPSTLQLSLEALIDPAFQAALALRVKEHFDRLTALGHVPSIWSRTVEDLVQPIDTIRVGNKFDTMRSRRNDQPETYAQQAL